MLYSQITLNASGNELFSYSCQNKTSLFLFLWSGCRPLLHVDFANDTVVNLRRDVYINAQNTDIQASGMEGVQYGLFNGRNSFIEIPYLSGIALDKFFIRLRFYSAAGGGAEDQVLFSNCESTISRTATDTSELPQVYQRPSMAVILNKPSRLLTFIAQTDTSPKTIIRLPFLVRQPFPQDIYTEHLTTFVYILKEFIAFYLPLSV